MRLKFATRLQKAQETLETGTPIWRKLNAIIQLLLPQFGGLCNDIIYLCISTNESETLMDKVLVCGKAWEEAAKRGRFGSLDSGAWETIFADLLDVVDNLQEEPDMKNNTRLQYIVKFISDLETELKRRPMTMKNPEALFMYVKGVMTQYTPPYVPPALDIRTVVNGGKLLAPSKDEVCRGGNVGEPQEENISTLLWQMRQLCV
jgi:hypothetical protein